MKNFAGTHAHTSVWMNTIAQFCDLWEAMYANWSYVRDPPDFNDYLPARNPITNGLKGNCIDNAIFNAAVIASIRRKARVVIAYDRQGNGYAYPEVYLGDSIEDLQTVGDYLAPGTKPQQYTGTPQLGAGGKTEYWLNLNLDLPSVRV